MIKNNLVLTKVETIRLHHNLAMAHIVMNMAAHAKHKEERTMLYRGTYIGFY